MVNSKGIFKFLSMSFKFELIFYNLLLIIFPLIITSIISYTAYKNSLFKEASDYNLKIIYQLNNNIDMYLEDMVGLSVLSMYDEDLQNILKRDINFSYINENAIEIYREDKLRNFLFTLNNMRTEFDGVFIYDKHGKVYYSVKGKGLRGPGSVNKEYNYKESEWYKKAEAANGKSVIIETHIQEQMNPGDKKVFSIAKIIKDIKYGDKIGVILIDVSLSGIEKMCSNVIYSNNEGIVIFGQEGKVIYSTNSKIKEGIYWPDFEKIKYKDQGSYLDKFMGEEFLVTYTTSQYSTWKVVRYDSVKQLLSVTNFIKTTTYLILSVSLILAIGLLYFISNKVSSPIRKMREKMKMVEKGNLDVKLDVASKNEIGKLSDSFNKMVMRLKELVHRVYEVQLQKKEAQLTALQSQINPHFLYNTLDSIHMMAEINEDYQVSKMITSLGKLLRYSIKSEEDFVKIKDEIEHVKNYVKIQQVRYENKFKLFVNIKEGLEEYNIIKLVLQPLVENCIYHGINCKKGMCYILLDVEKTGDLIIIKIIDNGVGMGDDKLALVKYQINNYDNKIQKNSIGISNVNHRIKSYFGAKYGLTVSSRLGIGTEVQILIPAIRNN